MTQEIELKRARALAESIVAKRTKFGKLGRGTFTQDELQDAVTALYNELEAYRATGLTPEDVKKLRRQLAAAEARVARASKRQEEDAS